MGTVPGEKTILESLTTPLLVVARDGEIRFGNAAASLFWRVPGERLITLALGDLFAGDGRVVTAVERAVAMEASSTIDDVKMERRGWEEPRMLRVQVDPVQDADQPGELALVAVWDETQRERIQAVSREAQLMHSMGLMIKGLAHELRNPLSGIKGATQLLARRLERVADQAEYPAVILKELERLERLIKSLLAYGDDPPLTRSLFNLHELLDEVLWFVANSEHQVDLVRDFDPSLPECSADRDRLHQVFLNLVRNAAQATPPGGRVILRTAISGPWSQAGALPVPGGIYFRVEVEDGGPGVPEENRERMFMPFFTTKTAGSGLGLSICRQIVWAHRGWLEYRPGKTSGSVFTVILPVGEKTDS